MCLSGFRRIFSCVLTVGISPTKSMSTKTPKLGETFLQYIFVFVIKHVFICLYTHIFWSSANKSVFIYTIMFLNIDAMSQDEVEMRM